MKEYILLICCLAGSTFEVAASEKPTFIQQVNTLWKSKDYPKILQLATTEAAKNPSPPESHAVLFGYHLYITANHEQAIQSLNSLLASLENTNPEGHQVVTAFKAEFLEVPSDQMKPPTPKQFDGLHLMFPNEFPVKSLLFSISAPD